MNWTRPRLTMPLTLQDTLPVSGNVRQIIRDTQWAVDRQNTLCSACKTLKESWRVQKDLLSLHQLYTARHQDPLACITRQAQDRLSPLNNIYSDSLRRIRAKGKVHWPRQTTDRHLERKRLHGQEHARLQAQNARRQAEEQKCKASTSPQRAVTARTGSTSSSEAGGR
ncbi:unnamed protein product [Mortierella alpina]